MTQTVGPKGAEMRVHQRRAVMLPVELQVYDGTGELAQSDPMHAIVVDVSESGFGVQMLGPNAAIFAQHGWSRCLVKVQFLGRNAMDGWSGQVVGVIRWSREGIGTWGIGVQITEPSDQSVRENFIRHLTASAPTPLRRRNPVAVAAIFLALCIAGIYYLQTESLRERLDVANEALQTAQQVNVKAQEKVAVAETDAELLRRYYGTCQKDLERLSRDKAETIRLPDVRMEGTAEAAPLPAAAMEGTAEAALPVVDEKAAQPTAE